MDNAKVVFVCPKCKKITEVLINSVKQDEFICANCKEVYYASKLPRLALKIINELGKLFKKHAKYNSYTQIEFERDFMIKDDTQDFFIQALKEFKEQDEYSRPLPRFQILAYQFKCINTSTRMLLHDDSILYPYNYAIPASYSFSYTYNEVLDKPYLKASYKSLPTCKDDEFLGLYLFDYANLIYYTKLYNAYLRAFSQTHKTFAYLLN